MPAREPSAVDVSDDQLVRLLTPITASFVGGIVLVLVIGVLWLVPGAPLSGTGAVVGVALAVASWFGSRWITGWAASSAAHRRRLDERAGGGPRTAPGSGDGAAVVVRTVVFMGIGVAEGFGLVGLPIGLTLHDIGPFAIALPVAAAAVVLNASGPAAVRRHLQRARSGRTD